MRYGKCSEKVPLLFRKMWVKMETNLIYNVIVDFMEGGEIILKEAEQTLCYAACTSCGHPMIGAEIANGIMPCPECGDLMHVKVKGKKVSVMPVHESEAISPVFMKYRTGVHLRQSRI